MEWLTPESATASYEYEDQPHLHYKAASPTDEHLSGDRTITPTFADRDSRPARSITPGAENVQARGKASPGAGASGSQLYAYTNRSVDYLFSPHEQTTSSNSTLTLRRPSASSSPHAPPFLRASSYGFEDGSGSIHWKPELTPQPYSPPPSPGAAHAGSANGGNGGPPSASGSRLAIRPRSSRLSGSGWDEPDSALTDPRRKDTSSSSGGSTPASAEVAQKGSRRPGSVFEHVGGMLDRFGRRLHSRSETREAAKRTPATLMLGNGSHETSETVFEDDNSPDAHSNHSRPFSPGAGAISPTTHWDRNVVTSQSEGARSPTTERTDSRKSAAPSAAPSGTSNRSSAGIVSPSSMTRNLSAGSFKDVHAGNGGFSQSYASPRQNNTSSIGLHLPSREGKRASVMERTLIQVTEDNERFSVVDISGLNSTAAIKERMMSKLHLFDDDPSCFALSRTEIGSTGADNPHIGDDELLALCWQQGDDRGSLKFLLQQIAPPTQPSRAAVPPPPLHSASPRIVLRDTQEGTSTTNPSTPTTNSRPHGSKSGSLSSHSSMSEVIHNGEPQTASGNTDDRNESTAPARTGSQLSRTKATNRRSMANLSLYDDGHGGNADNSGSSAGAPSASPAPVVGRPGRQERLERRRELSAAIEEAADDSVSPAKAESYRFGERSGDISTDTTGHGQWEGEGSHIASRNSTNAPPHAKGTDPSRPVAQRTASHPPSSHQPTSPESVTSPSSAASAFPRSLLPGGREPRLFDATDAAHMYMGSPGSEDTGYGSGMSSRTGTNRNAPHVRAGLSADDIRRRSMASNHSADSSGSGGARYSEQDGKFREAQPHRSTAGVLHGPRPTNAETHVYSPDGMRHHGHILDSSMMRNFERERSASTGAGPARPFIAGTGARMDRHGSNPDPHVDIRLANMTSPSLQASRAPHYSQPTYTPSASANVVSQNHRMRTPHEIRYVFGTPHSAGPSGAPPLMRPMSPHIGEFGAPVRPSQIAPRVSDPRLIYQQARPQSLQDRPRYRQMQPPPLTQQQQQHMHYHPAPIPSAHAHNEDPYGSAHFPASSPRVVSEFQRFGALQSGLQPGMTVQEILHQPSMSPRQRPQQVTSPQLHPHLYSPQMRPMHHQHSSHVSQGGNASYAKPPAAVPLRTESPHVQDRIGPSSLAQTGQASSHGKHQLRDPRQTSSSVSAGGNEMPASMKYYYNPSMPVIQNHQQRQGQASAAGRQSGAHMQRPHTAGNDDIGTARQSTNASSERSSGSSFTASAASSHRRVLSIEDRVDHRPHGGDDSAPTSARSSQSMSPKFESSELAYVLHSESGHHGDQPPHHSMDETDLANIRPLPQLPPHGNDRNGEALSRAEASSRDGEDTFRAADWQNMVNRFDTSDGSEEGTAKAVIRSLKTATPTSPSRPASSQTQTSATSKETVQPPVEEHANVSENADNEGGTFASFLDDDEDDYDAHGGTWAQNLDTTAPTRAAAAPSKASDGGSGTLLAPHNQGLDDSAATASPRRPVLTLNIDSKIHASPQRQQGQRVFVSTPVSSAEATNEAPPMSSSPTSSALGRRTSFARRERGDWAFRPPPELLYENLDEYFPKHDLDKPVLELANSPQSSSPRSDVLPMSAISSGSGAAGSPAGPGQASGTGLSRGKLGPKKSIRIVAQDRKRFLERAEAAEQRRAANVSELGRRRSTKLWGGRVVEMTPGVEPASGPATDSPISAPSAGGEGRPIFKWVKGDLIGKGTYGRVYLALNATTGEMIAVKQVELPTTASDREDARQRSVVAALKSEIETLKDLDHPKIVSYLGFEETSRNLSIFLEYVPGGSVGSCLRKHGKLEEATIKSFLQQILSGLNYLHGRGILHRDLKADNLLVDFDGIVKISDFGTVRKSEDIYGNVQSMSMQGSIFWMAPEVVSLSRAGYSAKVDIWSLGCVVLEMFAGRRPWSDEEAVQAMFKIGAERRAPPIPPDVRLSKAAAHFLKTCFAVDPNERPTASRLLDHVFPHAEPGWLFSSSSLYRQLHR